MAAFFPRSATSIVLVAAALILAIPPLVFLSVAVQGGMAPADAVTALGEQYVAKRPNLAVVSALGLFPIVLLAGFLGVRRAMKRDADRSALYALCGALPAVAIALWVHLEYWPTFLPARTYAGFPHGLEFIIGPGAFAPIGMFLTLLVAWASTRAQDSAAGQSGP